MPTPSSPLATVSRQSTFLGSFFGQLLWRCGAFSFSAPCKRKVLHWETCVEPFKTHTWTLQRGANWMGPRVPLVATPLGFKHHSLEGNLAAANIVPPHVTRAFGPWMLETPAADRFGPRLACGVNKLCNLKGCESWEWKWWWWWWWWWWSSSMMMHSLWHHTLKLIEDNHIW